MMKINPTITLKSWRLGYCFRDPAILKRYSLDLLQAGVPQTYDREPDWNGPN